MLRELSAGEPCVFPACAFGVRPMAEMVRGGLFVPGFPPDSGDHIGLEIDGEISEFCVYRVRGEFHCEEIREANPRRLRHTEDDLTMHTLVRTRFYEFVATDLGITGQVIELGNGIWELGRKRLQGRDNSKVIFIEVGVPATALELTLMRDPFMTLCLLHHGKSPTHDWHSDKTLVRGVIEVRDGRYASDVFEDLSASQKSSFKISSHSPNEINDHNKSLPLLRSDVDPEIFQEKENNNFLTLVAPDYIEWKSIVLRSLIKRRNHFQAFLLGAINMAKLVDARIFDSADPLDDLPDVIWLDIDGGDESYEIVQSRDKIHCYKISIPSHCETFQSEEIGYEFTVKDFSPHKLVRENFYAIMAGDLGITTQVCRLGDGLWELGRKNIAGQGRARVIFVEQGVEKNDIVACLALHGFKTNCLLFHGKPPAQISVPDKNVVSSPVLVEDGRFFTEVFEDLVASRPDSIPGTGVDLDSTPQRLVILGEEFEMPLHRGKPLIGLRYLATCFDLARQCIPVWDLFVAVKPGLSDLDRGLDSTGMKRSVERPSIQPVWEDAKMDAATRKIVGQDLAKKRKRLESLAEQGVTTGAEVRNLNKEVAELKKYLDEGQGINGRKRALKHGDKEKARDSVRGGIKKVIEIVENQNPARAEELRSSLDLGYDVMFKPPPDWGI
jgi:hypothetical protein